MQGASVQITLVIFTFKKKIRWAIVYSSLQNTVGLSAFLLDFLITFSHGTNVCIS